MIHKCVSCAIEYLLFHTNVYQKGKVSKKISHFKRRNYTYIFYIKEDNFSYLLFSTIKMLLVYTYFNTVPIQFLMSL